MSLLSNIWIGCKQATFLQEKMREGKLSVSEKVGLQIHLGYCSFCRTFMKQVLALELWSRNMQVSQGEHGIFPPHKKAGLQEAINEELKKG
jgi:hypothetical protein